MKKMLSAVFFGAMLLSLSACSAGDGAERGYRSIPQDEAKELMRTQNGCIILDVRTREEFEQAHIKGAVCIPNEEIGSTPPAELADKSQLILVYCRSGNRSKQASAKLAALGYTNILEFGGINTWTGETVSGES